MSKTAGRMLLVVFAAKIALESDVIKKCSPNIIFTEKTAFFSVHIFI